MRDEGGEIAKHHMPRAGNRACIIKRKQRHGMVSRVTPGQQLVETPLRGVSPNIPDKNWRGGQQRKGCGGRSIGATALSLDPGAHLGGGATLTRQGCSGGDQRRGAVDLDGCRVAQVQCGAAGIKDLS